jgi:hypothetical protein
MNDYTELAAIAHEALEFAENTNGGFHEFRRKEEEEEDRTGKKVAVGVGGYGAYKYGQKRYNAGIKSYTDKGIKPEKAERMMKSKIRRNTSVAGMRQNATVVGRKVAETGRQVKAAVSGRAATVAAKLRAALRLRRKGLPQFRS